MENEELLTQINERLAAIGESVSDERLKKIVSDEFNRLSGDREWQRKMRFARGDEALKGSKYERMGLTVADLEFLNQLLISAKARGLSHGPSETLTNAVRDLSPAYWGQDDDDGTHTRANDAMDTAESGYGSQLIGAQYVGQLWEAARRESTIFGLFSTFEMGAPTAYLPVEVDMPEMYYVSENTASNASNYTTVSTGSNRVSVSAVKFVIHQMWSGEMEEDSIIPFVPFLRRQAQLGLAHYSDSAILNGDTTTGSTNINYYGATATTTKHYMAFDGLLHACITDNTNNEGSASGNAVTWDDLIGLRKLMIDRTYLHDWGHPTNPGDLVYVCDPETADVICKQDEVVTADKYGAQATVFTGEVAKIGRHPLVSSIAMGLSTSSAYIHYSTGNSYGRVLAFNKRGGVIGWRRRVKVETERLPATDQNRIVYSLRMGFGRFYPTGAASGIEWAALKYYIGV